MARVMELPEIPVRLDGFLPYITKHAGSIQEAMQPYLKYESVLREIYAQQPDNPILDDPYVNAVPLFGQHDLQPTTRARTLDKETQELKDKYLLPLTDDMRKPTGAPATVQSLRDFRSNFNLFSESSLADLDWSNVVAAGSSAVTALLPVPAPHDESKRSLRDYYHEKLAPASDVDLFVYGLDEEQGKKKIEQIERCIRDSILYETTTIRTKYAVTIASQYPCRHVQIVLRLYKSLSEVLTGFDVDSSCVAFDGRQVYATPRAVAALMTQINTIDLSRRSPSYENRLSKYARRGFEVFCPTLDRSRIDPTIFERSFGRVQGLARLLVLEKLPSPTDRDDYMARRREERGRPALGWQSRQHGLAGNIKEKQPDDVAEWVEADDISNYHTFSVPYGPKFHAKKVEKLLFTKDLLLNAEWNKPKDRTVNLHRHPAFFGKAQDVFGDCCGSCPKPQTEDELLAAENETELYIKGDLQFVQDNPGRQQIGSFNPITESDWTEMAYVGNTERLCQAIVDGDVDHVRDWCQQEGVDVNCRDHTGRTPLQLAAMCGTLEILQCLIDNGARLVARLVDGTTALHIAARRGEAAMVRAILQKSTENEEIEEEKGQKRLMEIRAKTQSMQSAATQEIDRSHSDADAGSSAEELDDGEISEGDESDDEMTQGSFVRVKEQTPHSDPEDANPEDPDVYDPNVLAWDYPVSPLHLAAMNGHVDVIEALVGTFSADVLLPVKIKNTYNDSPRAAIMTLVLAAMFAPNAADAVRQLVKQGATSSQADMKQTTALHFIVQEGSSEVLDALFEYDSAAATAVVNFLSFEGHYFSSEPRSPLWSALHRRDQDLTLKLLDHGASPHVSFDAFKQAYQRMFDKRSVDDAEKQYLENLTQPIHVAVENDLPQIALKLLEMGADVNTLSNEALLALPRARELGLREAKGDGIRTILDTVRKRQEMLKKALKVEEPTMPEQLREDDFYLRGLQPGSYRHWLAMSDIERAKHILKCLTNQRDREVAKLHGIEPGHAEKRKAIEESLEGLALVEEQLVKAGAKPFKDLFPEVEIPIEKDKPMRKGWGYSYWHEKPEFDKPYETRYRIESGDLSEENASGYKALFEAAWSGDSSAVKSLTLAPWRFDSVGAPPQGGKESAPPLQIAVQDSAGFSPFALAVLRGHLDLARTVVEIATVQYKPYKNEAKYRYRLEESEPDPDELIEYEEWQERSEEPHVRSYLVDDKYTVDAIAALADTTESRVSPLTMIRWPCQVYRMLGFEEGQKLDLVGQPGRELSSWETRCPTPYGPGHLANLMKFRAGEDRQSLWAYAIARNDLPLFRFLLNAGIDLTKRKEESENDGNKMFEPGSDLFDFAVRHNRPEMIGELLKTNGNRLPLKQLAKRSGVEVRERTKYYQGLTVYGKKRKDWADRSRGIYTSQNMETETPPLLLAARENRLDVTEYMTSNAPLRRYEDFAKAHRSHEAIGALNERPGGITQALSTWMRTRRELAVHATVLGAQTGAAEPMRQLKWLLDFMPEALDAPNCDRITPLHAAFHATRVDAARLLIERGADQAARDCRAENVLHHMVFAPEVTDKGERSLASQFRSLMEMLDPSLPAELLLQRSSTQAGAHTPLSKLLHRSSHTAPRADDLRVLLDFGGGKDLNIMDGAGDLPLHFAARRGWTAVVRLFVEHDPSLLRRENATGVTPGELLENVFLRHCVDNPPQLPGYRYNVEWWRSPLPDVETKRFDPEWERKRGEEDSLANARRLCRAVLDGHPGKRKLVSLFDANEVAQRISSLKKAKVDHGRGRYATSDHEQETERKDEIDGWMTRAGCQIP